MPMVVRPVAWPHAPPPTHTHLCPHVLAYACHQVAQVALVVTVVAVLILNLPCGGLGVCRATAAAQKAGRGGSEAYGGRVVSA